MNNIGSKNSLYDSLEVTRKTSNTDDDMSWGSSEFSSYDEEEEDRKANGALEDRGQKLIAATIEYKVKEQTPQVICTLLYFIGKTVNNGFPNFLLLPDIITNVKV